MKTLLALLVLTSAVFGQTRLGEQDAIRKSHIDLKKEYIYFVIHGFIETDGHTFCNDTTSNPFIFHADLEGTKIYRKNEPQTLYNKRNCGHKDCNVLHLETRLINSGYGYFRNNWQLQIDTLSSYPNNIGLDAQ